MKKIIVFLTFLFITISIFSTNNYFEFKLDEGHYKYQQILVDVKQSSVSRVELQLDSDYEFLKSYFNLSSWGSGNTYTIQLGFNVQTFWQNNNQKILAMFKNGLLSSSGTKIGEVLLFDSNGDQLDFVDIYFVVDDFFFEFSPPYPGSGPWYDQKISKLSLKTNLLPLHVYVGVDYLDGFDFLSEDSYLQFLSSPNIYLNNPNVEFDVKVGSNLGKLFNNYGSLLQEKYIAAGSPEEGLHVANVVISIPMEGRYFRYYIVPVYYKIPEPNIEITIGGSLDLTFDPANPQNDYISSVPVSINSTVPSYLVNLSLVIFEDYDFFNDYIKLSNDPLMSVNAENYEFDLQLEANFADLWNEKRELILSHFADDLLTVNENMHIGNVYITLSASSTN